MEQRARVVHREDLVEAVAWALAAAEPVVGIVAIELAGLDMVAVAVGDMMAEVYLARDCIAGSYLRQVEVAGTAGPVNFACMVQEEYS